MFYLLSRVLAVVVAALPGVTTLGYMFTPLVAALLTMLVVTREGWTRAGWASLWASIARACGSGCRPWRCRRR